MVKRGSTSRGKGRSPSQSSHRPDMFSKEEVEMVKNE